MSFLFKKQSGVLQVSFLPIIFAVIVAVFMFTFFRSAIISPWSVGGALDYLQTQGYVAYADGIGNWTVTGTVTIQTLTNGRVVTVGAGGLLGDDADLTFSGTTLTTTDLSVTNPPYIGALQAHTNRTVGATTVNGTTWEDLLDVSVITQPEEIWGFKVTKGGVWAGDVKLRVVNAAGVKIFPYDKAEWVDGTDFISGSNVNLAVPISVAITQGYKVQFRSSNAGDGAGETLTLDELDTFQR